MILRGSRSRFAWVWVVASILVSTPAKSSEERFRHIREKILTELKQGVTPSLAVVVSRKDEILWEEAFGWADRERGIRATPHTMLSIIIVNPGLDSRARTALEHMLESVVSARGKVLRTNFSATSRVTRATKLTQAASRHSYRWCSPPTRGSATTFAVGDGRCVTVLKLGVSLFSCPSSLFVRDWTLGPDRPRAHAGERGQRARGSAEDELLGDQPSNASDQADSGCLSPLVSMVQSTDSRQCDDFRRRRRSVRDRSQARCVLVQPQVATVLVIVADVSSHEPDEMTCAENHDVLKELATAAADPPLRGSVLPWAAKRSANGFCARCFDELDDRSAKDEVAIEDEIFRSGVVGKRLTQLLNNPSRRRVERGVEVNDVPTAVLDDEEAVQQPERSGGHGEQIHGGDIVFMVAQESHPSLQLVGLRRMPR